MRRDLFFERVLCFLQLYINLIFATKLAQAVYRHKIDET
jgi:hypothetical protein